LRPLGYEEYFAEKDFWVVRIVESGCVAVLRGWRLWVWMPQGVSWFIVRTVLGIVEGEVLFGLVA
jgi:hypothetical protein